MIGGDEEAPEEPQVDLLDQEPDTTLLTTFQIKPGLDEKFKPQQAKEIIYSVLQETLGDRTYPEDESEKKELLKSLAIKIKQKCRVNHLMTTNFLHKINMGTLRAIGAKPIEDILDWMSDDISRHNFLSEMDYAKYKYVVTVVMGDQKGAGVSSASRCFWDAETDVCASNTFLNGTIFCMAAVFAVYFY